jgi:hypothetical protein
VSEPANPAELIDLRPDEALAGADMVKLPPAEQRPVERPPARGRRGIVAAGVALTAATLGCGIVLVAAGVIDAIASGFGTLDLVAIAVGALLVATHWGWIHVAEATANTIESRRDRGIRALQQGWLDSIKPYTRYAVTTNVLDDGSIRIARLRHTPVRASERTFTFEVRPEREEVHSGDEPAAAVSDRAEVLRRQAALDTERERRRWKVAFDAYERAVIDEDDEQQRAAARLAASRALSDQINVHLREPPLVE